MSKAGWRTTLSALLVGLPMAAFAQQSSPVGTWIDHTGEGAVEISECNGGKLCGKIVWLKKASNESVCNMQVIGDAKPVGKNRWDNGWVYDPDAKSKYDVELTPQGRDKLKVYGYLGSKLLGEEMIWTRAPSDLTRCDKTKDVQEAALPADAPKPAEAAQAPAAAAASADSARKDGPRDVAVLTDTVPAPAPAAPAETAPAGTAPAPAADAKPETAPLQQGSAKAPETASIPAPEPADRKAKQRAAAAPAPKRTANAEDFEIEGVRVRRAGTRCSVTIKELGNVSFPCD